MRDRDVAGGEGKGFQVHQAIQVPTTAVYFDKLATNAFIRQAYSIIYRPMR